MSRLIILLIFLVASEVSFSQASIKNKNYTTVENGISIAYIPLSSRFDKIFFKTFTSEKFSFSDTSVIVHNILYHEQFNNTLRQIIDQYANLKISKPYRNIFDNLTEDEISDLKNNLLNADIIILRSGILSKIVTKVNGTGFVLHRSKFTVYDLKTGEFVLQCNGKFKQKFTNAPPDIDVAIKNLVESYMACFLQIF